MTDENGSLRKGSKVIKKGEIYEAKYFEKKDPKFKSKTFLNETKEFYTELMNRSLEEKEVNYRMRVFDRNDPYLPLKKIGKNNPNAKYIRENNKLIIQWNMKVSKFLSRGVPVPLIIEVKKSEVIESIRTAMKENGTVTDKITEILSRAILTLSRFISNLARYQLLDKIEPSSIYFTKLLARTKSQGKNRKMEICER